MIFFIIAGVLALFVALYPLRRSPQLCVLITPLIVLATYWGYNQWGALAQLHEHLEVQANQTLVKKIMETPNGPDQLIAKLKSQLQKTPDSGKGWYLLGRLSASKGNWKAAEAAFTKASQLNPDDEVITVNYAQSLWHNNHQHFNKKINAIFHNLLKKNPNQPDALAMLAMDAYANKQYKKAINYWEQLLKLAPPQSEEALALRKAIAKASKSIHNTIGVQ